MNLDEQYMQRCFELAKLGAGKVSPNPMVGAVLVHDNRIIGEGWHQEYGKAHAEVNAVASVSIADRSLIQQSTLYVSLEPCCIFGKTPPCTNLIIEQKIPRVVISCLDQTPGVAGRGLEILRSNGVTIVIGVLQAEGEALSRYRNHFVSFKRPYVILKFAVTLNGKFGLSNKKHWISNEFTRRLSHKWRSEIDAILVGTNTALVDNPELTNRFYFGKSPLRVVIDRYLRLPATLHLFDKSQPTLIVTEKAALPGNLQGKNIDLLSMPFDDDFLPHLLGKLYERNIATLMVEGGANTIRHFLQKDLWEEANVLVGNTSFAEGIDAPLIPGLVKERFPLGDDQILLYKNIRER